MLRCLLVTPIYTTSPLTGGGQRTQHLYRALARLGRVDVALVSERVCWLMERDLLAFRAHFPEADDIVVHRSTEQFLMAPPATRAPCHPPLVGMANCAAQQAPSRPLLPCRHCYRG